MKDGVDVVEDVLSGPKVEERSPWPSETKLRPRREAKAETKSGSI